MNSKDFTNESSMLPYGKPNPYGTIKAKATNVQAEPRPRIRRYTYERPDGSIATRYEVLNSEGMRVPGQGVEGFDDLENAKELLRRVSEGQIYSTGGGAGQSMRYFKPRNVPNQDELDEVQLNYQPKVMNPQVMQRVAKDIMNPPKVMQQRAIRDQERQKQYIDSLYKSYGQDNDDEELPEAANLAQQAAIAINMKKQNKKPKHESAIMKGLQTEDETIDEDLRKWFKEKWVRFGPDGKIRGSCARGDDSEGKPKCLPQKKAQALGKKGRASAAARKRREDPNPERSGKAINVATKKKTNEGWSDQEEREWLDAIYGEDLPKPGESVNIDGKHGIVKGEVGQDTYGGPAEFEVQYDDGTIKIHSVDTIMTGDSSHDEEELDEACWKGYHKEGNKKMFGKTYPNCVKNTNEDLTELAVSRNGNNDDKKTYLLNLAKDLHDALYVTPDQHKVKDIKNKIEQVGGSVKILYGGTDKEWDGSFQVVMYHPVYFKQGYLIKMVGDQDNYKFNEEIVNELKCWPGYHRVKGTKAGFPGSCAKNESQQGVAEGRENYNGINILFQQDDDEVFVKASAGGRELGHVLFVNDGEYLIPQDLEVEERFRNQGIAQTMYDFVKSKGYKIRRSGQQTDAGAGFWAKHRPEQNVWEQGVAESQSSKTGIYQTDVYGTSAYHAKCLEPNCDWESKRYDRIKQAQQAAQKHAEKHFDKKQSVAEGSLNEFDPGEGGFGPFKLYKGDRNRMSHIGTYKSIDDAEEELEFQKDQDSSEGVVSYYKIVDGTGEQVGGYDPDEAYDSMRSSQKAQYRKSGKQGVGLQEGVNDNYLYHATQPSSLMRILKSGNIKASYRPQEVTKTKTKYPTISTTRSKQYAESDDFVNFLNLTNEGNTVIMIFDKKSVANHYKMFSSSQGTQTVGDEFEEVIVVPKGTMPIRGTLTGFYFNPRRTKELKEFENIPWFKELLNSPYYMGSKQGITEGIMQATENSLNKPDETTKIMSLKDLQQHIGLPKMKLIARHPEFKDAFHGVMGIGVPIGGRFTRHNGFETVDITHGPVGDSKFRRMISFKLGLSGRRIALLDVYNNFDDKRHSGGGIQWKHVKTVEHQKDQRENQRLAKTMSKQDVTEERCPHCNGPMFEASMMNEKKDACYYKVKSRYKVWPSAYASGALVQCRKKGAKNWGTKSESIEETLGTPYPGTYEQSTKEIRKKGVQKVPMIAFEEDQLDEKWSEKYKRSIDCSHPKGFSQRAHCQGRKKK